MKDKMWGSFSMKIYGFIHFFKVRIYNFILILFFSACLTSVSCEELQVDIRIPRLQEGMTQIEAMLAANIGIAVIEVEEMASNTLKKDLVTSACGRASGTAGNLGAAGVMASHDRFSMSTGIFVGADLDTFNMDTLTERFDNIQPEDDFSTGAGSRGVAFGSSLPLEILLPGLFLWISGSYMDLEAEEYFVHGWSAGISMGYSPFSKKGKGFVGWTPLTIKTGAEWGRNNFGTAVEAGLITETFELDLDGSGPLIAEYITIEVEPVIDVALVTEIWTFSCSMSTALDFSDFIEFYLGGGMSYICGSTGISADSESDITVLGYLSDLIETDGSIIISGEVEGGDPAELSWFINSGLIFQFGRVFLNLPFIYKPPEGLGAGLVMGVEL